MPILTGSAQRVRVNKIGLSLSVILIAAACGDRVSSPEHAASSSRRSLFDAEQDSSSAPDYARGKIAGSYIVLFKDSVQNPAKAAQELVALHGGAIHSSYVAVLKGFAADLPDAAVQALSRNPRIERIDQDAIVNVTGAVQSPVPSWGLDRVDQGKLPLSGSYSYANSGTGVNVYIVDTGIRTTHVDFGGRASGAFTVVDDGYGTSDCNGHGTHVAGIVGGKTHGIAKDVRLFSVRVLNCAGSGTMSQLIAGLDWVAQNRQLPAVVNLSVGGDYLDAVNQAVAALTATGVTVVAAAGNSAGDACAMSPASAPEAITVGSTGSDDAQALSSNSGKCLDIYAPGVNIISDYFTTDSARALMSGTSMAAPHVTGAVALYLVAHPDAGPDKVAQDLLAGATVGVVKNTGLDSPNRLLNTVAATTGGVTTPTPATDVPPTASFSVNCTKTGCAFDATASLDDHGIATYSWSFGDASPLLTVKVPKTSHSYASTKAVEVVLTVTDSLGQTAKATRTARPKR